jgi:two-component system response regulator WspF
MRIAIVNDMRMACEALRRVVESVPDHRVVWTASDGAEAIARVREDRPDLILMDLVMPRLDGAETTRRIMSEEPCAILVVTATVSGNMGKVYEAMGHGALDAVDTPVLGVDGRVRGGTALLEKVALIGSLIGKPVARADRDAPRGAAAVAPAPLGQGTLVLLGASTGGPKALAEVLADLPADLPAGVIIVQHVDAAFASGLASWLGEQARRKVELIEPGRRPEPGQVLVAETNDHLVLDSDCRLCYVAEPAEACFRPSVDVFFASVAAHWPDPGVAVLLTGMGRDGASGLLALRRGGWHTLAQDEATSVVWGMPRAAAELGAAERVLPVDRIAGDIAAHLPRRPA